MENTWQSKVKRSDFVVRRGVTNRGMISAPCSEGLLVGGATGL